MWKNYSKNVYDSLLGSSLRLQMNLDELLLRLLRISWVWFQVLRLSLRQDEANRSTMMPQQEKDRAEIHS